LKFEKRSQFFVGGDDESLSVVAVCISNEDRLSVGINRCDAAPTPTGFAEIVSDDFPELHVDRIVPLLVSTQQSQNDMKGRNEFAPHFSERLCCRSGSLPDRLTRDCPYASSFCDCRRCRCFWRLVSSSTPAKRIEGHTA
jgi:hypothetical protein